MRVCVPLPFDTDPQYRIPIKDRRDNDGLHMAELECCWRPFCDRQDERNGHISHVQPYPSHADLHNAIASVVHPDHLHHVLGSLPYGVPLRVSSCRVSNVPPTE